MDISSTIVTLIKRKPLSIWQISYLYSFVSGMLMMVHLILGGLLWSETAPLAIRFLVQAGYFAILLFFLIGLPILSPVRFKTQVMRISLGLIFGIYTIFCVAGLILISHIFKDLFFGAVYLLAMLFYNTTGTYFYLLSSIMKPFYNANAIINPVTDEANQRTAAFNFNNDWKYSGELERGVASGYGKLTYPNGRVIEGTWKYGIFLGEGCAKIIEPDGRTYEGNIKNAKYDGHGKLSDAKDDITYEGGFKEGKRHGYGTTFSNSTKKIFYQGDYKDGEVHGRGRMFHTAPVEAEYNGEFISGVRHGQGIVTYADGRKYEGAWENGVYHGFGKLTFLNGKFNEGNWKEGKFQD